MFNRIKSFVPILDWLPNYRRSYLKGDITAGITVGIMLVPQGMAYAMIAGLPPVYGLYAAIFPQVIYAIFGTSRQLAVGPVAMDSLLVAAGVSTLAEVGSENYIAIALLLALMMGFIQLLFGLFKLGFLVNFLSKPVISGFTSAAAIIIGLNQLLMTTSKQQTLQFGAAKSTSSPVDSRANPTALQENEKVQMMSAIYGPKCLEQYERLNPGGLWGKTFLELFQLSS